MKFAHLVTLLLAFWAPFNAVTAGASMLDCPMSDVSSPHMDDCPAHADAPAPAATTDCDHCAACVVHGGLSLPNNVTPSVVAVPQAAPDTRVADQIAAGVPATPFRPPLSA